MKKTILICGLISGAIVSLTLIISTAMCYNSEDFKGSMVIGFSSMFLAFSLIFVGVKNYRDKFNNGTITFGKAFLTGLYIALISSTIYVVAWLIDYYLFIPDFMERYAAMVLKEAREAGVSAAVMQEKVTQMEAYSRMYKNPVYIVLLTYMEIFPIGLGFSLIAAFVFKRKQPKEISSAA